MLIPTPTCLTRMRAFSRQKPQHAAATALALNPTSRTAGINLAVGLAASGDRRQARHVLDGLIRHHPTDPQLWFAKAELYENDDELGMALQTLAELQAAPWLIEGPEMPRIELAGFRAVLKHRAGRSTRREAYVAIRSNAEAIF